MVDITPAGSSDANAALTSFVQSGALARTVILKENDKAGNAAPVACLFISLPVAEEDLFSVVAKAALGLHFLGHLPGGG